LTGSDGSGVLDLSDVEHLAGPSAS
jgi:hypothetical protein